MARLPLLVLALLLSAGLTETLVLAPPGTVHPYGEKKDYRFTLPPGARSARLVWTVRLDAPPAGSTHAMLLELNGRGITGGLTRTQPRLLNKPLTTTMASGLVIPWVRGREWRVVYSPDFELVSSAKAGSNQIAKDSPYRFVAEISDLVSFEGENVLQISHLGASLGLRRYFPENTPLDLVFGELTVETSAEPPPAVTQANAEAFSADRLMWQPPAACRAAEVVKLGPDGGLTVALPGLTLEAVSRFSWEGGSYNTFGRDPDCRPQPEWRVTANGTQGVVGTARDYRVNRTVRWNGHRVDISDELTNLTANDIGLRFDHRLRAQPAEMATVYLNGDPDPAKSQATGYENSSVFVEGLQSGCALLAQDDVSRVQGVAYYDLGAGIRSDSFCLPAGGSYTLRWSLYPVGRPDYYDFINLARRDLGVNSTVPGGFDFSLLQAGSLDDATLKKQIDQRGLRYLSSGVWMESGAAVPCYHGPHMLEATNLRQRLRAACDKLRRVAPETKSLIYIHCYINTDPKGPERFADSRVLDKDGKHYENTGYTQSIGIPFLYYYPALDNRYFGAMKDVVDMCLDREAIGADGIYWDEVEMMSAGRSYDRWDGHSAELDAQHRIVKKYGHTMLLSLEAKKALTEYVQAKGGELIGNSVAQTETMMRLGFPRFVETASIWYPARTHLYTPIALGDHLTVKTFDDLLADIRLKLMWGSLYYYYSRPAQPHPTITQRMFPFTPIELHRGWLLGRERLLTAVPGTFTLGDDAPVSVHWYGADGKEMDRVVEERVEQGRRLVRLPLGEREMAVIVRR